MLPFLITGALSGFPGGGNSGSMQRHSQELALHGRNRRQDPRSAKHSTTGSLLSLESMTFRAYNEDLGRVQAKGKQLWVQLQDRAFSIEYNPVAEMSARAPLRQRQRFRVRRRGRTARATSRPAGGPPCTETSTCARALPGPARGHGRRARRAHLRHEPGRRRRWSPRAGKNNFTCQGYPYFDGLSQVARGAVVTSTIGPVGGLMPTASYLSTSFDYYAEHGVGVGGPDLTHPVPQGPGGQLAPVPVGVSRQGFPSASLPCRSRTWRQSTQTPPSRLRSRTLRISRSTGSSRRLYSGR